MGRSVHATRVPAMYVLQWFMLKKEIGVRFRSQKGRPEVFREALRVIRERREHQDTVVFESQEESEVRLVKVKITVVSYSL